MVRLATLLALFAIVFLNGAMGRRMDSQRNVRRSAMATPGDFGWWFTLKTKAGMFCGLRDYPPRSGYGTNRVYCVWTEYDNFWMWRLTKANGTGGLSSGDQVILSTYNPAGYKLCAYKSNIYCSVPPSTATKFVIEKVNGSGPIDLTSDDFYLKVADKYCWLSGTGHSQQIKCDKAAKDKSKAVIFNFPASTFANVNLQNKLTKGYCGGNFLKYDGTPDGFYCGPATYVLKVTNLTLGLAKPGAAEVVAGANVTFKTYEDRWTYQEAHTMQVDNKIKFLDNEEIDNSSFFTLERTSGAPTGGALDSGSEIAIRSPSSGKYCGQTAANQTAVACDQDGPAAGLPDGYKYVYRIVLS